MKSKKDINSFILSEKEFSIYILIYIYINIYIYIYTLVMWLHLCPFSSLTLNFANIYSK